jgi:peroxiredoxin Q/BCP
MPTIAEGEPAPDFSLKDQNGRVVRLSQLRGRSVIIYFYPEDDTPLCTTEACGFRDLVPRFDAADAVVCGISADSPESHAAFATKHKLPFTLLCDEPQADGSPRTALAYGVWREKTLYGRKYTGLVRTTYLIGPDGRVRRRWDHVRVKGHADRVLEALRPTRSVVGRAGKGNGVPVRTSSTRPATNPAKPGPASGSRRPR